MSVSQLTLNFKLNQQASFNNFFVGDNQLLVDSLKSFIAQPQSIMAIYGAAGSGRSHLLNAACLRAEQLDRTAMLLPLKQFIHAPPDSLQGLDNYELLCIDDLDVLAGNASWETALFHLINRCKISNTAIIVTAEQPLRQLPIKLADLKSRLLWGSVYKVKPIDRDQLIDFIIFYADKRYMRINPDVAEFIVRRTSSSVKLLLPLLETLERQSLAERRLITIPFVKSVCNW